MLNESIQVVGDILGAPIHADIASHFRQKLTHKHITLADCWEYQGGREKQGYGQIKLRLNRKPYVLLVHRISWALHRGPIPPNALILHKCDNPPCFNPDHLFLGDHRDNALDAISKHGYWNGGRPAIISTSQSAEIMKYIASGVPILDIARVLGVHKSTIYKHLYKDDIFKGKRGRPRL